MELSNTKLIVSRALNAFINSGFTYIFSLLSLLLSFYWGQQLENMSLFASFGGVVTILGLLKTVRFSTIEKYLNFEKEVGQTTGMTGTPVKNGEAEKIKEEAQNRKKRKLENELTSEFQGIFLTGLGTLVASFGSYIPIFL
ncbi:hypothetical protein [Halomonas cerina]|uniref:Uncharacterized protein n=1 Tax=Halomonas cerina TaxID=447424 RepID=A0A839VDB2_9GAMM|nr:hypothetical protein [Halomonas cerina]MBB3192035.1 hypothetical protein [Halomonas cerina]